MKEQQYKNILALYKSRLTHFIEEVYKGKKTEYIISMLEEMEDMDPADEKTNRWLGFVQGYLWSLDIYSIDDMRYHNTTREKFEAIGR